MGFLAEIGYGRWRLGIGDPTIMGWITAAAYLFTAAVCWSACKRHKKNENCREASFWLLLTLIFIILGINKQMDLQTLLTEFGREISKSLGWYESRHSVKKIFLAVLGLGCLMFFYFISRYYNNVWQANKLACAGVIFLAVFIVVRAMTFQHIFKSDFAGFVKWILELGGIGLVLAGAVKNLNTGKPSSIEVEDDLSTPL